MQPVPSTSVELSVEEEVSSVSRSELQTLIDYAIASALAQAMSKKQDSEDSNVGPSGRYIQGSQFQSIKRHMREMGFQEKQLVEDEFLLQYRTPVVDDLLIHDVIE
ncbi:hypothetical protein NDU88_007815 [Pleurodeles waltl]|uniref:Uncharacterized protein n=1 Tax=Pleurodeles waltl TaxID=8319 RepID=A0AAV7RS14_PLEWA|nr:hypothetical protein NDU88_007815 [Pleurodeles waltl]